MEWALICGRGCLMLLLLLLLKRVCIGVVGGRIVLVNLLDTGLEDMKSRVSILGRMIVDIVWPSICGGP